MRYPLTISSTVPFMLPNKVCRSLEYLRTKEESRRVTMTVRKMVPQLNRASCQQYHSMMAAVPMMVSTPLNKEGRAWETVVEMFSTSLVMRLITSPWEWVSVYLTGRSITLPKSSSRNCLTMRRLNFALNTPCIRRMRLINRYVASMQNIVVFKSPSRCPAMMSTALLCSMGA